MTKVYITFGQIHTHKCGKYTLDRNCVAVINCSNYEEGQEKAFDWFDGKFHNCYDEEYFNKNENDIMKYYPRGLIEVN